MQHVISSSSTSLPSTFSTPLARPPRTTHEQSSSLSMISTFSSTISSRTPLPSTSSSSSYQSTQVMSHISHHHHTCQSPQSSHHHTSLFINPTPIKPTQHPWLIDLPSHTSSLPSSPSSPKSTSSNNLHTHTHSTHMLPSLSPSPSPSLSYSPSSTSHLSLSNPVSPTSHSDMSSPSHSRSHHQSISVPSHYISMSSPLTLSTHIPPPYDYFDTCARRGTHYLATYDTQPHQHIQVNHHHHLWNFLHTQTLLKVPAMSEEEKAFEQSIDIYATVPLPPRKRINKTTTTASTSSDVSNTKSTTTSKRKPTSTPHYSFVCECDNIGICKCICTIQPQPSTVTYQSSDSIKRFKVEETMMDANELMALAMKMAMNGDV